MRSNGVNFILLVQRRKKIIGLRLRYVVGREPIGKGKERYYVIEIVYAQLQDSFPRNKEVGSVWRIIN